MLNDSSQQDMLSSYPKQLDKKKHSVTLKLVKNKHKKNPTNQKIMTGFSQKYM